MASLDEHWLSSHYRRLRALAFPSVDQHHSTPATSRSSSSSVPSSPYLIIFGGTGFVGSSVTREALSRGISVISFSRHGPRPSSIPPSSVDQKKSAFVSYQKADIQHIDQWGLEEKLYFKSLFSESIAVISCVGAFGGVDYMRAINGTSNVHLLRAAKLLGAKKFIYVSSHAYTSHDSLQKGYFEGKKMTEKALINEYKDNAVILRPGFIYGTRNVSIGTTSVGVPLWFLGKPLEFLCRIPAIHSFYEKNAPVAAVGERAIAVSWQGAFVDWLFTPPEPVEAVAKTIIDAALDKQGKIKGILETDDIHRIGHNN